MKKIGIIVFGIAIIIGVAFSSLFSFGRLTGRVLNFSFDHSVKGSGNITKVSRDVSDFSSVDVGGIFQVEIVAGKDNSVEIEADDNLIQFIKTDVRGDTLKISSEKGLHSESPIRVRISAPNIERVEADGASKVTVSDIKNSSLDIDTSGASKVYLAGSTDNLNVQVSGASKVDAENLAAAKGNVEANGASQVTLNVAEELRAEASGASKVTYTGNPGVLHKDVSGASSINKK
jgi:hypothetical protein